MPAVTTIVLTDGKATPIDHTFTRNAVNGATMKLVDGSSATLAGRSILTIETRSPSGNGSAYRVRAGLGIPVEATDSDGNVSVARVSSAEVMFNLSPDSTVQEREDLVKMLGDLMAEVAFIDAVQNIEPFY